ncbi:MAG: secondary thiamine-phosphate synthase enzyme YjbQ [Nanoarchaeota archaeon]|nr:secondary thiamine-phosphate synthase enzyme YjbQ [Nanoarchaeota archaeon]
MIYRKELKLRTRKRNEIYDITDEINCTIAESGIKEGIILIQSKHATTGLIVNENEPNALEDIIKHLETEAPFNKGYNHDKPELRKDCPEDEPLNCDSHIKATCYSQSSIAWSVHKGSLELGRYQRVLFQEFDGPCPRKHKTVRKYLVKILGE